MCRRLFSRARMADPAFSRRERLDATSRAFRVMIGPARAQIVCMLAVGQNYVWAHRFSYRSKNCKAFRGQSIARGGRPLVVDVPDPSSAAKNSRGTSAAVQLQGQHSKRATGRRIGRAARIDAIKWRPSSCKRQSESTSPSPTTPRPWKRSSASSPATRPRYKSCCRSRRTAASLGLVATMFSSDSTSPCDAMRPSRLI